MLVQFRYGFQIVNEDLKCQPSQENETMGSEYVKLIDILNLIFLFYCDVYVSHPFYKLN